MLLDPGEIKLTTSGCLIGSGSSGGYGTNAWSPTAQQPVQLSNIAVQKAAVSSTSVAPGQDVEITASVINKGTSSGTTRVTLYVNGQEDQAKGITVSGGQASPVRFTVNRSEPGTYTVYVNNSPAGSFTVEQLSGNDVFIYSIIALFVLGIAGTLFFLLRRRPT